MVGGWKWRLEVKVVWGLLKVVGCITGYDNNKVYSTWSLGRARVGRLRWG